MKKGQLSYSQYQILKKDVDTAQVLKLFFMESGKVKNFDSTKNRSLDKEALKRDLAELWSDPVANLIEGNGEEFDASLMYSFKS